VAKGLDKTPGPFNVARPFRLPSKIGGENRRATIAAEYPDSLEPQKMRRLAQIEERNDFRFNRFYLVAAKPCVLPELSS